MKKRDGFDYRKAEADLEDIGAHHPDEIYSYRSEKALRGFMKEHGLNPEKYYKDDPKNGQLDPMDNENSGCYLTTACVAARGLSDTCIELQTLRAFRDDVLAHRPGGQKDIEEYYQLAPHIVEAINQRPDAVEIWGCVYDELVETCVHLIQEGHNNEAYQRYKEYTYALSRKFLS